MLFFFFKQKTAYEMRISDWSSDVCSSDLARFDHPHDADKLGRRQAIIERRRDAARPDRAEERLQVAVRIEREDADAILLADAEATEQARTAPGPIVQRRIAQPLVTLDDRREIGRAHV